MAARLLYVRAMAIQVRFRVVLLACVFGVAAFSSTASAAVCDLTMNGDSCTVESALFFELEPLDAQGSGVIDPFLRIERHSANDGPEYGYNTEQDYLTGRGNNGFQFQYDQKNPVGSPEVATRNLLLSDVPVFTINDIEYREFLLDINEPGGNKSLISLDDLQIFLSDSDTIGGPLSGYDPSGNGGYMDSGTLGGLTAIYDLDTLSEDNWIKLDYSLNSGGSGSGDMVVYIPNSLFNIPNNTYVYLYSAFGLMDPANCCEAADGFEEWWVRTGQGGGGGLPETAVPEPGTLLLVGGGLLVIGRKLRRRPRRS